MNKEEENKVMSLKSEDCVSTVRTNKFEYNITEKPREYTRRIKVDVAKVFPTKDEESIHENDTVLNFLKEHGFVPLSVERNDALIVALEEDLTFGLSVDSVDDIKVKSTYKGEKILL